MTKVVVKQNNELIQSIEIKNHAGFAESGNDIVCAAISSIVFGALNALDQFGLADDDYVIEDAYIKIVLNDNEVFQIVVKTMIIQLQTIQESYPDYIQIKMN